MLSKTPCQKVLGRRRRGHPGGGGGLGADSDPQHRRATRIPRAPPCHSCRAARVPQSGRPGGAVSAAGDGTRGGGGVANCRHNRGHGAPVGSGGVGRSASAASAGLVAAALAGVESCGDGRAAGGAGNGDRAGPAKGGEWPPLARPTVGAPHETQTFSDAAWGITGAVKTTAVVMAACRGCSVAAHSAVGEGEASADVTTSAFAAAACAAPAARLRRPPPTPRAKAPAMAARRRRRRPARAAQEHSQFAKNSREEGSHPTTQGKGGGRPPRTPVWGHRRWHSTGPGAPG